MHLVTNLARAGLRPHQHVAIRQGAGVSTALFSSNWSKLKVPQLKAELRSRGLLLSGRKQELVNRLEANDADTRKNVTSGAPLAAAALTTPIARRNFSQSATQQRPAAQQTDAPDPTPRDSKIAFTAKKEASIDEQGSGVNTQFPTIAEEQELGASVPIITPVSNSKSGSTQSPQVETNSPSEITTTISPESLPGGGPSSAHHDLSVSEPSSAATGQGTENRGVGNFKRDSDDVTAEATKMFEKMKKDMQESEGGLYQRLENISGVPINFAEAFRPDGAKFQGEDRDLNGEEVRGLYMLGGILLGGFLLGSFGKKSKPKKA